MLNRQSRTDCIFRKFIKSIWVSRRGWKSIPPVYKRLKDWQAQDSFNKRNEVNVFLAADGVHLLNVKKEGEVVGQGTGDLKNHLDVIKENNIKLYVSGMSAKARGYDDSLLDGFNAEFAMPDKLLELSADSNTVLCY